jgi:hypothetical protein
MLGGSGTIGQLNMGLGKTRVITPALYLEIANTKPSHLVRITLLSQIYDETFEHFHRVLSNSLLARKLFKFPFHRDVDLDFKKITMIWDHFKYCQKVGGCIIVTAEDRNSLNLKLEELQLKNDDNSSKTA